jgi:hypothetical protein
MFPTNNVTISIGTATSAPNRSAFRSGGRAPGAGMGDVPGKSGAGESGIQWFS